MKSAPLPTNEDERLAVLRSYEILDTPPEERFDRVTRLVSEHLGVPISLVSLVDVDRQWFKSAHGIDATETPREVAFCAHAILDEEPLVVPDASKDTRFHDNPLVADDPSIRFYAGAPLVTSSGHRLGTLCAIDRAPKQLNEKELGFLREMAAIVVDEMELFTASRRLAEHSRALEDRNEMLDTFAHSLSHDLAGPIRRIKILGDILSEDPDADSEECLGHIMRSVDGAGRILTDLRTLFLVDREVAPVECDTRQCLDHVLEGLATDLRAASAEVEVSGALPSIRFFPGLLETVFANLLDNALKYRAERPPRIEVHGEVAGGTWSLSVTDNGIGIAPGHQERVFAPFARLHREDQVSGSGLGLHICKKILARGGGTIDLESTPGEGARVTIRLPAQAAAPTLAAAGVSSSPGS